MATRYGTSGRDRISGTRDGDHLYGYSMDGGLPSDWADDTLDGGEGEDYLHGGGGADTLLGGLQNDHLDGGPGGDVLDGGGGFDTATYWFSTSAVYINLLAGAGYSGDALDDTFISIEKVIGSSHDDVIVAGNGGNVLDGWIGDDRIYGGDGRDDLYGGAGIDRLYGGANVDNLYGGSETDYLWGEDGEDTLDGGDGDDVLRGGWDSDTFIGSSGADTNYGGDGERDLVDYSESSRRVEVNLETGRGVGGLAEGDRYDGIEDVTGSRWDDRITGTSADNHLRGGDGVDAISGGGGDDLLFGGAGADQLDGGSHTRGDTISYQDSDSTGVWVDLVSGMGRFGDAEGDKFARIENVTGSIFKDTLVGDRGNNVLKGWDGNDELYGNEGNDSLWGGRHGDRLWGDAGSDSLYGEMGSDTFIYRSVSDSPYSGPGPGTHDYIFDDFLASERDMIDLSAIDADTTAAAVGDQPFTFVLGRAFTGAGQLRIEYVGSTVYEVLGETTGDGVADLHIRVLGRTWSHFDEGDIVM